MRLQTLLALAILAAGLTGCIGGDGDEDPSSTTAIGPPEDDPPRRTDDRSTDATNEGHSRTGVAHETGGRVTRPPPGSPPVAGDVLPVGGQAVEPTLGFTPEGTLFYMGVEWTRESVPASDEGQELPLPRVYRSEDGGGTWTNVTPEVPVGGIEGPPYTFDPFLWVDEETGRVFTLDMFPIFLCGWLSWSDDSGASWTNQPLGCTGQPGDYDHQSMGGGPPVEGPTTGYENALYQCANRGSDTACSRSLDGGLTWTPIVPPYAGVDPDRLEVNTTLPGGPERGIDRGFCGGGHGHPEVGPGGTLYIPSIFCGQPMVAVSTDEGRSWSLHRFDGDAPGLYGPDPSVAVDDEGNAFFLWENATGDVKLSSSTDQGSSWSDPASVRHPNVTAAHLPTIDAEGTAGVAIAYAGTEDIPGGYAHPEYDDGYQIGQDPTLDASTWHGYLTVTTNALAEDPVFLSTRVNEASGPLVRGPCGPGRCPGMYDFIDVQISPTGRPYGAFVDACTGPCDTVNGTASMSQGDNQSYRGLVGTLRTGPSLLASGQLPPLGQ